MVPAGSKAHPASVRDPDSSDPPINLLWTGGWDSTYRLLQLTLDTGATVQPVYVLDLARRSSLRELQAMSEIRRSIEAASASAGSAILPTRIVPIPEIREDARTTTRFNQLRARRHLGTQYDWLTRMVEQNGIEDLELCIHVDDSAEAFVRNHVVFDASGPARGAWVLQPAVEDAALELFRPYRFPLLRTAKTEMREAAERMGFASIMNQTWFCFRPRRGQPCGLCNPCHYTITEGMGDRVPVARRLLHHAWPLVNGAKGAARRLRKRG